MPLNSGVSFQKSPFPEPYSPLQLRDGQTRRRAHTHAHTGAQLHSLQLGLILSTVIGEWFPNHIPSSLACLA